LDDKKLFDLIIQVTGAEAKSSVAKSTLSTLKALKAFADFDAQKSAESVTSGKEISQNIFDIGSQMPSRRKEQVGLNLSYTINLNLPATSDQAVFNAIFRSLKEHLLSNDE
jgi:hypothetical protein